MEIAGRISERQKPRRSEERRPPWHGDCAFTLGQRDGWHPSSRKKFASPRKQAPPKNANGTSAAVTTKVRRSRRWRWNAQQPMVHCTTFGAQARVSWVGAKKVGGKIPDRCTMNSTHRILRKDDRPPPTKKMAGAQKQASPKNVKGSASVFTTKINGLAEEDKMINNWRCIARPPRSQAHVPWTDTKKAISRQQKGTIFTTKNQRNDREREDAQQWMVQRDG